MDTDTRPTSGRQHSRIRALGVVVGGALAGPALGLLFYVLGMVLAPPWTSLTGLLYLFCAGIVVPVAMMASLMHLVKPWGLLVMLALAGVATLFYLAFIGPGLPGGMTDCRPVTVPAPRIQYTCVSTSSDDPGYHDEFTLEGLAGWPVARLKRSD